MISPLTLGPAASRHGLLLVIDIVGIRPRRDPYCLNSSDRLVVWVETGQNWPLGRELTGNQDIEDKNLERLEAIGVNAPQIEYWNGAAGEKWARQADSQDVMLEPLGMVAMNACDIKAGHKVLDIGCGSGSTTIEIARRVGAAGRVVGMDISTPMLNVARARINALNIEGTAFENKDVATFPFPAGTFDRLFSRFGVMFFVDPIAAFTNIRGGLKSDGRLGFVCWQALNKNQWFETPINVALKHIPPPPPSTPDAPGPMAFAKPDRVRSILSSAGFGNIDIEPLETTLILGADVAASVQKLVQSGPVSRLLNDASEDIKARVAADLGDALVEFETDGGVKLGCAVWIVTASPA